MARLLDPIDGPGTRRPKNLLMGALRSLGDGPPAGGPFAATQSPRTPTLNVFQPASARVENTFRGVVGAFGFI